MKRQTIVQVAALCAVAGATSVGMWAQPNKYARDPKQAVDAEYTQKIREYTTEPYYLSPLVDYLPASKTVPTPKAALGDVAGAPGILPYSAEVHEYMRMLEKASPRRVKVFSIGKSEEGREMIAVAIADDAVMAKFEENRARLAKLADPRTIAMNDAEADRLVTASVPVYYITASLHAGETGSPTALMELAYRLVVDDSPYIKAIRSNLITIMTPVLETDGRDRHVDVYRWHLANPTLVYPSLPYWGKYVLHDNNRDAMAATLMLTRNVIDFVVQQKAQVLHDLHESVPYLYDNTVGDGPYNAWVDPILTDEWQLLGWNNMSELTRFGMPGAFAHGTFDTWSPGYLMFIGAMHNGTSRLYETFGNAGADTVERTLQPDEYARTWYRQNPPLPRTKWSQRNNNNYTITALLTALSYYGENNKLFLKNFYLKSKRSVLKPKAEGPAAYVFPADEARPGAQAELLRTLMRQAIEISRATAPFTVRMPVKKARPQGRGGDEGAGEGPKQPAAKAGGPVEQKTDAKTGEEPKAETRTFPAGSYVVRMDQPYSRIADALLDYQYWSPNDPQKRPYDDTGWTFGELFNVQVVRVTDATVLDAAMERVRDVAAPSDIKGSGPVFVVANDADPSLFAFRYRLKTAGFAAAEEPFDAAGRSFPRGSFIVTGAAPADVQAACRELGVQAHAVAEAPAVKTHAVKTPRIGYVHTWIGTQDEGWWRMEFDRLGIPYDYTSTQVVAREANLIGKWDVLVFPPVGRSAQQVVAGMPMWRNPLPWKTTPLTPNIGKIDSTDDMRPGLGWGGLANLEAFVRQGGLLIVADDTSVLAGTYGFTPGLSVQQPSRINAPGTVMRARIVDPASPIAYGYGENLSVYSAPGLLFGVSNTMGGRRGGGPRGEGGPTRPTGRGTADDHDQPQGRPFVEPEEERKVEPWQAAPVTNEQLLNPLGVIPPAQRPRVVLRYGDARELLVSGLLDNGSEIAQRPLVVDVPLGKGHLVLFANNPMWRGQTQGSYALVFNAILNYDQLDAGRKLDEK
ncbi:MAG TPA: M14 family zinc carboxypeptidase [Vicinamibacterales bacterium]|nr:M14 family zinc carboxypeptidase [Vicinamibacterales bacterium]